MKKAEPVRYENGSLVIDPYANAASADWLRAGRLQERADAGDEEAARELKELENTYFDVD